VDSTVSRKIHYGFRRPRFPVIYAVGSDVLSATPPAVFQRQAARLGLDSATGQTADH
jgi:hypothetical protein